MILWFLLTFFASEFAQLFPDIPRWLGIQQKSIALFLAKWHILFSNCVVKGSLGFLFFDAVSADKESVNYEIIVGGGVIID